MAYNSRILMLYTGGTIGMVKDPATGSLKPFNFQHLLSQIPELAQFDCDIDTDSLDHPD
ncbi:MAG: asparaginase domain-containing protein [Owenweeksia sp.]|nr:asparaginase domain-containing protein [Owenweeksia sp.]